MHYFLQERFDEIITLQAKMGVFFADITHDEFNLKLNAKSWSMAECVNHLLSVYDRFQPFVHQVFAKKMPAIKGNLLYKPTWIGKQYQKTVNPEKTLHPPKNMVYNPTKSNFALHSIEKYKAYLSEVQYFLEKTATQDIDFVKVKIRASFVPFIIFNLGDYFHFETSHNLMHFFEMQHIKNYITFTVK